MNFFYYRILVQRSHSTNSSGVQISGGWRPRIRHDRSILPRIAALAMFWCPQWVEVV